MRLEQKQLVIESLSTVKRPAPPILINWLEMKTTDLEVDSGWSYSLTRPQNFSSSPDKDLSSLGPFSLLTDVLCLAEVFKYFFFLKIDSFQFHLALT